MRLVLALPAQEDWAVAAGAVLAALPPALGAGLCAVPRAELHVTLRFLGEVAGAGLPELAARADGRPRKPACPLPIARSPAT